jgi:hypothetical protein
VNPFKSFLSCLLKHKRPRKSTKAGLRSSKSAHLAVEQLDDRCLPSSSPLTLAGNHNLDDGSKVVLQNVEVYQWCSTTNMGFALQQGGILDDFTYSSPTKVNAAIGGNIDSFGVSSDGTLYELIAGGQLQVSTNSGKTWSVIDSQTDSFGVTTSDTLYDMEIGGELRFSSSRGSTWSVIDYNSESIAATSGGTLYNQLSGGVLESSTNSGKSWTSLDTISETFSVTTSGTLYDLSRGGKLRDLPSGGSWKTLDTNTQSFAATPGNTLYNLLTGGTLKYSTNTGSSWTTVDSDTQTFNLAANGAIYVLDAGGNVRLLSYTGSSWQTLDTAVQSTALAPSGTLYDLDAGGTLQSLSMPGAAWKQWYSVTESFALSSNGTLYDLDSSGLLIVWNLGGYWEVIDFNTQAFSVGSNGTLYNLLTGGLLEYGNSSGNSWGDWTPWATLDTDTQAFAIASNGTLYDLADSPEVLWSTINLGGSWNSVDSDTQSFTIGNNGTIYNLLAGGMLEYSGNSGSTWTTLDTDTQSFAVTGNGTLYDLADSPEVLRNTTNLGGNWNSVDVNAQSFVLGSNGTIYDLQTGGLLEYSIDSGIAWTTLDTDTQSFAVTGNGTLYDLADSPEVLWSTTNLGSWWSWLDGNTQSFTVGTNGTLYDLQTGGLLEYSTDAGNTWNTLDTATQSFAVTGNGTLYDLADNPGVLWSTTSLGSGWSWLDGNTQSFAVGTNGTLYNLLTGGLLEYSCDAGNSWTTLDTATQSFAVSGNGMLFDFADSAGVLWSTPNLGASWYWLDGNTQSFAVGTNGTLYNQLTGGYFEYSSDGGNSWNTIDYSTQSFAVSGNGTLYYLARSSGTVYTSTTLGNYWYYCDNRTESFTVGTNGTLYKLLIGGVLEYSNDAGNSWTTLDADTQAFAVSGNGTLYNLAGSPQVFSSSTDLGSTWNTIGYNTQAFFVGTNGTLYNLTTDGTLEYSTDFNFSWSSLDGNTQSFAVNAGGTLYNLLAGGQLEYSTDLGGSWISEDANTSALVLGSNGAIYNLLTTGQLVYSLDFGNSWNTNLDSAAQFTQSFAVSGSGTIYNLLTDGQLEYTAGFGNSWTFSPYGNVQSFSVTDNGTIYLLAGGQLVCSPDFGNTWNTVDGSTQVFAITMNGTIFDLESNGTLMSWGGAENIVDRLATSFSVNSLEQLNETDWFNANLPDAGLAALADSDFTRDDGITRNDFIGLLEAVASRGDVTNCELTTLQTLLDNSTLLNIPDYVRNLAAKVIDGNPANANYQDQPLGDLAVGSSPTQVLDLMQKWFYGTDLPASGSSLTYELAGGTLFSSAGPESGDVVPGSLNDDPFLTALSQLAAESPAAIESMFINNGDGTYTVRFFNNGVTDYVTVNQYLPVTSSGQFAYANAGQSVSDTGNVLWVALAEKAYAQLAEEGWSVGAGASNSYEALNGTLSGVDVADQLNSSNAPNNPSVVPVFTPNPEPSGTPTPSSWFAENMPDAGLAALAAGDDARDGSITRNDFIGLLEAVASRGPVTDAELTSLENLLALSAVYIPDYVQNLAENVVGGNPANAFYQGESLGNLAVGSAPAQVLDLMQKWFFGTDNPTTDSNPAIGVGNQYVLAGGTLFGSSGIPSYNDVAQGEDGTCYFLSALGELAIQCPSEIENMFTNNGDGTYTVRFYNNGAPSFVTVNDYLPVNGDGTFLYAGYYQNGQPNQITSGTNILWVSLAEKAYAQLAEEGWSRPGQAVNSYDSISGGYPQLVLESIINAPALTNFTQSYQEPGNESTVIAELNNDDFVCVGTLASYAPNNNLPFGEQLLPPITVNNGQTISGQVIDATHIYMLQSYDEQTGLFTLINPYDDGTGSRTIEVDWTTLTEYFAGFDYVAPPAGVSVSSVIVNS